MKKRKILAIGLSVSMLASMLAGCSSSTTSSTESDGGTTEVATEVAASGEEIVIELGSFHVEGQGFYEIYEEIIPQFNEDYDGIYEIQHDALPTDSYNTNVATLGAANELYDFCYVKGSTSRDFGQLGVVMDLNDLLEEWGITDIINESAFTEHSVNGTMYAIPVTVAYYGFIAYNTEIFEEVGIEEFPTTVDELIAVSEQIEDAGYVAMALGDKELWPADSITFSAFVNQYVGADWTESIINGDGVSAFTDDCFVSALTAFQSLESIFNDNLSSIDNDEALQLYMSGEVAMKSSGDWEMGTIVNSAPEVAAVTDVANWPGPSDSSAADPSIEQSSTWGIAISSNVDDAKLEGIRIFLTEYLMTDEIGQQLAATKGTTAAWDFTLDESVFNELAVEVFALANESEKCSNWDSILLATVKTEYQRGLQEVLLGLTTPEKLAEDMQEAYELEIN